MGRWNQDDLKTAVEAARWLYCMRGASAHQDGIAFDRWLLQSPQHRRELFLASLIDVQMNALRAHAQDLRLGSDPDAGTSILAFRRIGARASAGQSVGSRRTERPCGRWAAVVACVTALLLVAAGVFSSRIGAEAIVYSTQIGEKRTVALEDGTTITLNTNTQIEVAFSMFGRRIELLKGELLIDVGKDSRPFEVRAGSTVIQDVGTRFDVRRHAAQLDVAVHSGQVNVTTVNAMVGDLGSRTHTVALFSGQAVTIRANPGVDDLDVRTLNSDQFRMLTAWTNGVMLLNGQRLDQIVAELNRYNVRQIHIQDPELAQLRVGGSVRLAGAEEFASMLTRSFPIQAIVPADTAEPIDLIDNRRR